MCSPCIAYGKLNGVTFVKSSVIRSKMFAAKCLVKLSSTFFYKIKEAYVGVY